VTAADDRLGDFERGASIEVPFERIEGELAALWRRAADPRPGERPRAVTRACLWNLVVRVDRPGDPGRLRAAKEMVDQLSAQVPARVIVLGVAAPDGSELRAWVEANWRPAESGPLVGSDEVTLLASGRAAERLPALVRSLLLCDVPSAMLWLDAPLDPSGPAWSLLREVDRLIFDSRKFLCERGLKDVAQLAAARPDLELADLSWLGISALRGLCASMFDPPRDPSVLEQVDRARVVAGVGGTQSRALLTLGWLAARLGWREIEGLPDETGGQETTRRWRALRPSGGCVTLELVTRLGGARHGVIGLEIEGSGQRWSLARDAGCIDVRAPGMPERVQPARSHADVDLVVSALGARGRDPIFREALRSTALLVPSP
jgi:hypothetical protein